MKLITFIAVVLLIGVAAAEFTVYSGSMGGDQCVPAAGVQGRPYGNVGLKVDWDSRTAYIHMTHNLNAATLAAIGVPQLFVGVAGTNADAARWTFETNGDLGVEVGTGASPCIGSVDFSAEEFTTEELAEFQFQLANGQTYISFGVTLASGDAQPYTGCACRGQLWAVALQSGKREFRGELLGSNEVPPNNANSSGTGYAEYDWDKAELYIEISTDDIESQLTDTHLHYGAEGSNGGQVFQFSESSNFGNARLFISNYAYNQIFNGLTYINVHTVEFPSGEVRGNIFFDDPNAPDDDSAATIAVALSAVMVALVALLF